MPRIFSLLFQTASSGGIVINMLVRFSRTFTIRFRLKAGLRTRADLHQLALLIAPGVALLCKECLHLNNELCIISLRSPPR